MLRLIGAFVLGGLIGAGVGFAGGIFAYPYIFLTDIVGTDTVDTAARREVARGEFIHVRSDPLWQGQRGRLRRPRAPSGRLRGRAGARLPRLSGAQGRGARRQRARRRSRRLHDKLVLKQCLEDRLGLIGWDTKDLAPALTTAVQRHHQAGELTRAPKAGHPEAE
jgi:hypothetical protein